MGAGKVTGIFIGSQAAEPLRSITDAELEAGRGIVGDRYYDGVGTFSEKLRGKPDCELTLIEIERMGLFRDLFGFCGPGNRALGSRG